MGNNSYENKFESSLKWRSKCLIDSPNGIIKEGTILTGQEWVNVLVFDIGNSFDEIFEPIESLPKLYKKTSTGKIQEWEVHVKDRDGITIIVNNYGQVDGKIQESIEQVLEGKNIGKANETTTWEQAVAQAKARWEKQKKKGYVENIEDAKEGKIDDVIKGGVFPILAYKFAEQGHKIKYPALAQPKLDGHRCIAQKEPVELTGIKYSLWSRTRKPINSVPHIAKALEATGYPYLDGELWNPDINVINVKEKPYLEIDVNGNTVFLDEEDLSKLRGNKITINAGGYPITTYKHRTYYLHKLVLNLPESDVDHKNRNKLDVRKNNLRLCCESNNAANSDKRKTNTTGFKGVMFFKRDNNWHAQITHNYKKIHIGYYNKPEDAARAYDKKAYELFGEYAFLNYPRKKITFEDLTSFIRQEEPKEGHEVVQYHVYDIPDENLTNKERYELLESLRPMFENTAIKIVETVIVNNEDELYAYLDDCLARGYEGCMVRNMDAKYEYRRSYGLQKLKKFLDSEYKVVGVKVGTKGSMAGKAIFTFELPELNDTFDAKMMGKLDDLIQYAENPELIIGKMVTVKYQGLTKYGKPRFPVAIRIRCEL